MDVSSPSLLCFWKCKKIKQNRKKHNKLAFRSFLVSRKDAAYEWKMQKWNCKNAWTAEFQDSPRKNGYSQMDKERVEQSVEPCLYSPRDPQASGYMYTKIGQTGGDRRRTLWKEDIREEKG